MTRHTVTCAISLIVRHWVDHGSTCWRLSHLPLRGFTPVVCWRPARCALRGYSCCLMTPCSPRTPRTHLLLIPCSPHVLTIITRVWIHDVCYTPRFSLSVYLVLWSLFITCSCIMYTSVFVYTFYSAFSLCTINHLNLRIVCNPRHVYDNIL